MQIKNHNGFVKSAFCFCWWLTGPTVQLYICVIWTFSSPLPALTSTSQTDEPNVFGNTALHIACHMGQDTVASELVNSGANINQLNHHGNTPLHLAAIASSGVLCLELLVNNGAEVNVQVKLLKRARNIIYTMIIHVSLPAFHRIKKGRVLYTWLLCMDASRARRFWSKMVTFCVHLELKCIPQCMFLPLYSGGEVDCVDINGNSPLHVAARYGQELLISTLLTNGADKSRYVSKPEAVWWEWRQKQNIIMKHLISTQQAQWLNISLSGDLFVPSVKL